MEYSIGELVYYEYAKHKNICVVLNKSMGYSWACLTGDIDEPNAHNKNMVWFYHIEPLNNPDLFYADTNMCSFIYILQYDRIPPPKEIKKFKLV